MPRGLVCGPRGDHDGALGIDRADGELELAGSNFSDERPKERRSSASGQDRSVARFSCKRRAPRLVRSILVQGKHNGDLHLRGHVLPIFAGRFELPLRNTFHS